MVGFLLMLRLAASSPSPPADQLVVDAGVVPVAGAELFVGGFTIDRRSNEWPEDAGFFSKKDCQLPTPDEWLAAAAQPGFEVGAAYELVEAPWTEDCRLSRADQEAIVEAEGVIFITQYYASGLVPDGGNGPSRIIRGDGQEYLAGDPTPRAYRCVASRTPVVAKRRYVAASGINLRPGRGANYPILDGANIGSPVDQLYTDGTWSFVTVKLHREECEYQAQGWVKDEFLGDSRPDRQALLAAGRGQLEAKQFAQAAMQLERAYAFDKGDKATRELLLEAYDGAGMTAEADKVRREAKKSAARRKRKK